jgi:hypothetical protein
MDRHGGKLGAECKSCHSPDGFRPVIGFDHARTGFALTGAHEEAPCRACHGSAESENLTAGENPAACESCHLPGHGEELGADCARCHDPAGGPFRNARAGFDHRATIFPLERRHQVLACKSCHPASGPAPIPRCVSCHLDPHSGQLTNECAECHRPDRWRLARFDHDRAGWPLRGRHFVTPCAECHTNQRWVGLTSECFDCHALDAARARIRLPEIHAFGRVDCRDCHQSGWRW